MTPWRSQHKKPSSANETNSTHTHLPHHVDSHLTTPPPTPPTTATTRSQPSNTSSGRTLSTTMASVNVASTPPRAKAATASGEKGTAPASPPQDAPTSPDRRALSAPPPAERSPDPWFDLPWGERKRLSAISPELKAAAAESATFSRAHRGREHASWSMWRDVHCHPDMTAKPFRELGEAVLNSGVVPAPSCDGTAADAYRRERERDRAREQEEQEEQRQERGPGWAGQQQGFVAQAAAECAIAARASAGHEDSSWTQWRALHCEGMTADMFWQLGEDVLASGDEHAKAALASVESQGSDFDGTAADAWRREMERERGVSLTREAWEEEVRETIMAALASRAAEDPWVELPGRAERLCAADPSHLAAIASLTPRELAAGLLSNAVVDTSHLPGGCGGMWVEITGLKGAAQHNGKHGQLKRWLPAKQRFLVQTLAHGTRAEKAVTLNVRPANLQLLRQHEINAAEDKLAEQAAAEQQRRREGAETPASMLHTQQPSPRTEASSNVVSFESDSDEQE